jgi:small-conductance mechanosensitive channel
MNEILRNLNIYYHKFLAVLPRLGLAVLIFIIGLLIINIAAKYIKERIKTNAHDPLMSGFLTTAIKIILTIVLFMFSLNIAGLSNIAAGILGIAGASAVVIGFAFKDIAENFLAGIILAFNRPFHVGDTVQIENVFGKIITMQFRYTKITTFDGKNVYIPNSDVLTKPVFNYTEDNFFRTDFVVGIAYENNIEEAKILIRQCLEASTRIVHDDAHVNFVVEDELAASTVNLKVYFWINTKDFRRHMMETRGELMQEVKAILEDNGFNLPANITELKFYDGSKPFSMKNEKDNK